MRDLLFKNLTSPDKRRKVLTSLEIADKQGLRNIIRRHFICLIKEIEGSALKKPVPSLYILKEHSAKEQKERFFCRLKGSVILVNNGKLYLLLYAHSLSITIIPAPLIPAA